MLPLESNVDFRPRAEDLKFVISHEMNLIPFPENSSSETAFLITHHPETSIDLSFIPAKIKTRMLLMQSGWCGMGTCFIPPGETVSETELSQLLTTFNCINQTAGRPNDHDVIIRTGVFKGGNTVWEEPAFVYTNLDNHRKHFSTISQQPADFDHSMEKIKNVWKMIHGENPDLQRQAIHGRIYVDKQGMASMEIGTNVLHARALENGKKFESSSFRALLPRPLIQLSADETYPTISCAVHSQECNYKDAELIFNKSYSLLPTVNDFIRWVNHELKLTEFTSEFRYYTHNCHPDQRFNVMDIDTRF